MAIDPPAPTHSPILTSLVLENFRCHALLEWPEPGRRVCLEGPNGTGKTSLLEAVYLLSRCKSFRTPRIAECAGWGKRAFGVAGVMALPTESGAPPASAPLPQRLKFEWSAAGRQLSVDSGPPLPVHEFWGRLPVVAVCNSDRELVRGSGSHRRNWVDSLAAARCHDYLSLAQKALLLQRQKNAILKREPVNRALWGILTGQMRPVCAGILEARAALMARLAAAVEDHYRQLTGLGEHIGFASNRETERRLEKSDDEIWSLEERSRNCELGPHREDWEMTLGGKSLRHFGSEGQQKSAALAMRLAEMDRTDGPSVILIDDALIELDADRRGRFWRQIPASGQVLYASTDASRDDAFARFDRHHRITPGQSRLSYTQSI